MKHAETGENRILAVIRNERGLATQLGNLLGISRSAVGQWRRVPSAHVLEVAKFLRVHPHDIRPDLYPPPRRQKASANG